MSHPSRQILLSVLYRDASEQEAQGARAHLAACASCRDYFEEMQSLTTRLSQWPEEKPLPDTFARILSALPQTQPLPLARRVQPAFSFKPILAIAFAIVGIALALYFVPGMIGALQLETRLAQYRLVQTLGSHGMFTLLFLGAVAFFTLAFAPVLFFNANRRSLYI